MKGLATALIFGGVFSTSGAAHAHSIEDFVGDWHCASSSSSGTLWGIAKYRISSGGSAQVSGINYVNSGWSHGSYRRTWEAEILLSVEDGLFTETIIKFDTTSLEHTGYRSVDDGFDQSVLDDPTHKQMYQFIDDDSFVLKSEELLQSCLRSKNS